MNPYAALQLVSIASNGGDMNARGLGQLRGIAPLDKYVYAGSVIEWNGEVWGSDGVNVAKLDGNQVADAKLSIDAGLWGGWFSDVKVSSAGWSSTYITINVTTATDFAKLGDVLSILEGAVWNSSAGDWPFIAFKTIDLNVISTPIVTPGASVPSPTPTGALPTSVVNQNQQQQYKAVQCGGQYHSDLCGCGKAWNWFPPGCYPADANGDTGDIKGWTTTAIALGAVGALLAVIAIGKVVK